MKIPYDRVLVQPFQYNHSNFEVVPEIEVQDKALVHTAAITVANVAGAQALVNPARTYCFNVLSYNAWHNSDLDTIVGMVCTVAMKKAKLGAFVSPEAALQTSAEEVLMLYTCSLVMSNEGVRQACQPSVKHTAAQNMGAWLSLKQEHPTMYQNGQQYGIIVSGYTQAGVPIDQYGQAIPPHLIPHQQAQPQYQPQPPQGYHPHMVGVGNNPMTPMYSQQGPYVPNNQPVFSGAPNPNVVSAQPAQQPQQLYASRPPGQYLRPTQQQLQPQQPQAITQAPVYQAPVNQVITQAPPVATAPVAPPASTPAPAMVNQAQARNSLHTYTPENRVLVVSNNSILEAPMDRSRHMLTSPHEGQPKPSAMYGGGTAELGQVISASTLVKELHDPGKTIERRNAFMSSIVYSSSIQEAAALVTQYAKGAQFVDTLDVASPLTAPINTVGAVILTPVFTYFDVSNIYEVLAKSKNFAEYLAKARELCKGHEQELQAIQNQAEGRTEAIMTWQDTVVLIEIIDRIMTDAVNTYLFQSLHVSTTVDSILQDYEELIALVNVKGSPNMARDINDKIINIFRNIFSEVLEDQKSMFVAENSNRPGVDQIELTLIPKMTTMTYLPLLSRSLGVKLSYEFQKVLPNNTANLFKVIKEAFSNVDSYHATKPDHTPVMNSYIVLEDGSILEIYRSATRVDSVYVRLVA